MRKIRSLHDLKPIFDEILLGRRDIFLQNKND